MLRSVTKLLIRKYDDAIASFAILRQQFNHKIIDLLHRLTFKESLPKMTSAGREMQIRIDRRRLCGRFNRASQPCEGHMDFIARVKFWHRKLPNMLCNIPFILPVGHERTSQLRRCWTVEYRT